MELTNPLTIEERLQIPRLLGHDNANYFLFLNNEIGASLEDQEPISEISGDYVQHLGRTDEAVYVLSQMDRFPVDREPFLYLLELLPKLFLEKVTCSSAPCLDSLSTCEPILHSVLFNLIKNATLARHPDRRDIPIQINADSFSDFPENALYIPNGARDYSCFIAFNVHDSGVGFPKDRPLMRHMDREPPELGEHGFGLYFTGLASKVLRAPVHIDSVPGDTNVTLYHPVYESRISSCQK